MILLVLCLLRSAERSKHIFTGGGRNGELHCCPGQQAGSFSEDRPPGWDPAAVRQQGGRWNGLQQWRPPPVAETGNRCWGRGQQDASDSEADAGCRNPYSCPRRKLPACWPLTSYSQTPVRCRRRSAGCSRRCRRPRPAPRLQSTAPGPFCSAWSWGPPPAPIRRRR